MTLNGRTALYCTNDACFEAHYGNLKEDRPDKNVAQVLTFRQYKARVRIFMMGIPWRGNK